MWLLDELDFIRFHIANLMALKRMLEKFFSELDIATSWLLIDIEM